MPRGGKRPGAGRKSSGSNKKTREKRAVAELAAAAGITPLEVMLSVMRRLYDGQQYADAAGVAKDAAPYVHPRLAAIEHTGKDGKDLIPAVDEIVAALRRDLGDSPDDAGRNPPRD